MTATDDGADGAGGAEFLEPLLLDPTRLRVAATLQGAGEVEFRFVRDRVGLTDSALSKQVRILTDAGIVASGREPTGAARKLWLGLTPEGRRRLAAHAEALRRIATTDGAQT